jgi:hypothetical protein
MPNGAESHGWAMPASERENSRPWLTIAEISWVRIAMVAW